MSGGRDLTQWRGCRAPRRIALEGRFARLEPLEARRHGDGLFEAVSPQSEHERFRYLPEYPPESREEFGDWLEKAENSEDPLYFAVIDRASGKVGGRQTLMRIDPRQGVIETGHILWTSRIARQPAATEAFYLFANYIFDELGYRRFEWKCDNENLPSKRAALRFGMTHEGVFRQAAVVKGRNRDTAWFSIIDAEWPEIRAGFERWLDAANFDEDGTQIRSLAECRLT